MRRWRTTLAVSCTLLVLACSESSTGSREPSPEAGCIGPCGSSDGSTTGESGAGGSEHGFAGASSVPTPDAASGGDGSGCDRCHDRDAGDDDATVDGSTSSGNGGANGLGGAPSTGGAPTGGAGGGGSGGAPDTPLTTCAEAENVSLWSKGHTLYVDDTPGCKGLSPCYSDIGGAYDVATSGDTVAVLGGTYGNIGLTLDDRNVRITGKEGTDATIVSGRCMVISSAGLTVPKGRLWIDHMTFRNCGGSTNIVEDGWGIYVTTFSAVDVRIQDNVFSGNNGSGAIGLGSSTVGTRFHAVVARNRIVDNHSKNGALDVDLPADDGEDYCIRAENNVIAGNDVGVSVDYTTFKNGAGRFEFVNNTIANNTKVGVSSAQPAGRFVFVNNVIFGNPSGFARSIEWSDPFDVRNNLVDTGEFTGLRGNFSADPLFVDAAAGDYHLGAGSPAAGRGAVGAVPSADITGKARGKPPDLGAYERDEKPGDVLAGLACGDSKIESGPTKTAAGTFIGFETCDDGNTRDGDGCSSHCQSEPAFPRGQLSLYGGDLCVIRADQSLACWNEYSSRMPTGTFRQVALTQSFACALATSGRAACWTPSGGQAISPVATFTQIGPGYGDEVCGVHTDGSIACWDVRGNTTRSEKGNFAHVDASAAGHFCGLTAAGDATCWDPYPMLPSGPFVQLFLDYYSTCGLRKTGELVCPPDNDPLGPLRPLPAGLVQVSLGQVLDVGLRPDGHAVQWADSDSQTRALDHTFIEVAAGFEFGCGLTTDHRAYCWDDIMYGLPTE